MQQMKRDTTCKEIYTRPLVISYHLLFNVDIIMMSRKQVTREFLMLDLAYRKSWKSFPR